MNVDLRCAQKKLIQTSNIKNTISFYLNDNEEWIY